MATKKKKTKVSHKQETQSETVSRLMNRVNFLERETAELSHRNMNQGRMITNFRAMLDENAAVIARLASRTPGQLIVQGFRKAISSFVNKVKSVFRRG